MKVMSKRFLLAFCVMLCVVTAGWCVDPFKANKGSFGPKIKGVQLGMKMSLLDMVVWNVNEERDEFYIDVTKGKDSRILIRDYVKGGKRLYSIEKAYGRYASLENKGLNLGELLAEIEKMGLEEAYTTTDPRPNFRTGAIRKNIIINKDMRVTDMNFTTSDFGAGAMTHGEFLQEFVNVYSIPSMNVESRKYFEPLETMVTTWVYRNTSEGWGISYDDCLGGLKVFPIVTESKFD